MIEQQIKPQLPMTACYRLPFLSSNKPTHYIECFQNHGKGFKKRVYDECIFVEKAKNGQAKVLVTKSHKSSVGHYRYVDFKRLINIYEYVKDNG